LKKRFGEVKKIEDDKIEKGKLNEIIGWLTCYVYSKIKHDRDLESILKDAVNLAKREIKDFLKYRVSRGKYRNVMKLLAYGTKDQSIVKS